MAIMDGGGQVAKRDRLMAEVFEAIHRSLRSIEEAIGDEQGTRRLNEEVLFAENEFRDEVGMPRR
jgi:hypothetical protein